MSGGVAVRRVTQALAPLYKDEPWRERLPALDELIFTVLTQHTSDRNAEVAFTELKSRFPDWQSVADAKPVELAQAIRFGGLANIKAKRIQQILETLKKLTGELKLNFLVEMEPQEARQWLMKLPGVGIKTASVVLSFAFGMPLVAVDTHIHRVAKRLHLIKPKTTAEQAHYDLEAIVAPTERFGFHKLLIIHGRNLCKARQPLCPDCPLQRECPSSTTK